MKRFMQSLTRHVQSEIDVSNIDKIAHMKEVAAKASKMFEGQLIENYVDGTRKNDNRALRLSTIGKYSAIELASMFFGKQTYEQPFESRIKRLLIDGFLFESQILFELELNGYKVVDSQKEVTWHGITGHPDFIVEDPHTGEHWVMDAKTCNDYYFKQIVNKHVYNERGYMTQLAAYSEATGLPACLVFKNKNTSELATFFLDGEIHRLENMGDKSSKVTVYSPNPNYADLVWESLVYADEVSTFLLTCCAEWEDIFSKYEPPYPNVELQYESKWDDVKKKYVRSMALPVLDDYGRPKFYVPSNISHPELMYVLEEGLTKYGKRRMYVKDFKYPEQYKHLKPDLYGTFNYDRFVESINS